MRVELLSSSQRRTLWKVLSAILLAICAEVIASIVVLALWSQDHSVIQLEAVISCKPLTLFDIDGKAIIDASEISLTITNRGRHPITKENYQNPLTLHFDSNVNILDARLTKSQPPEFVKPGYTIGSWTNDQFEANFQGNAIQFQPVLLNPNNSFEYRLVVDNSKSTPKVIGHIVNVELLARRYGSCR
jgi:hypothetical protein